jgi:hypothetical protein
VLTEAWQDLVIQGAANNTRHLSGALAARSIEALMEHGFLLPGVSLVLAYLSIVHVANVYAGWER